MNGYSLVNKNFTCFCLVYAVMWGLPVDYSLSALKHTYEMWKAYLFRGYANNVKCMYSRAPGHTVDFSEFL